MNTRIVVTLVLVFVAGVATGMVGMRYGLHDEMHRVVNEVNAAREDDMVLQHFREELNLSDEQTKKLATVLEDYQHYYDSLEDQIEEIHLRDQLEDLRSTGKSRIMEILKPEQRDKFEQMSSDLAGSPSK